MIAMTFSVEQATPIMNTSLARTSFAAGVFAVTLFATAAEAQATDPVSAKAANDHAKRPSIVFIIVDQRTYRLFHHEHGSTATNSG